MTHTSMPIQISQIASSIQAFAGFGRNGQRAGRPRAACQAASRPAIAVSSHPDVGFTGVGSSIVITLFAPRSPQGGGAPSPTRIVITGNGGASSGHGV